MTSEQAQVCSRLLNYLEGFKVEIIWRREQGAAWNKKNNDILNWSSQKN